MAKKEWIEFGSIRLGKDGKTLYLKIEKDISLKEGMNVQIEKPQDTINRLHELGFIKDEDLEKRLESIPEWKKYIVKLPPQD